MTEPVVLGVKARYMMQKAPGLMVPTQVVGMVNTVVEFPTAAAVTAVMIKGEVLGLKIVTGCKGLVTLIVSLPKFTLVGLMEMLGPLPGSILATKALPAVPTNDDL